VVVVKEMGRWGVGGLRGVSEKKGGELRS